MASREGEVEGDQGETTDVAIEATNDQRQEIVRVR